MSLPEPHEFRPLRFRTSPRPACSPLNDNGNELLSDGPLFSNSAGSRRSRWNSRPQRSRSLSRFSAGNIVPLHAVPHSPPLSLNHPVWDPTAAFPAFYHAAPPALTRHSVNESRTTASPPLHSSSLTSAGTHCSTDFSRGSVRSSPPANDSYQIPMPPTLSPDLSLYHPHESQHVPFALDHNRSDRAVNISADSPKFTPRPTFSGLPTPSPVVYLQDSMEPRSAKELAKQKPANPSDADRSPSWVLTPEIMRQAPINERPPPSLPPATPVERSAPEHGSASMDISGFGSDGAYSASILPSTKTKDSPGVLDKVITFLAGGPEKERQHVAEEHSKLHEILMKRERDEEMAREQAKNQRRDKRGKPGIPQLHHHLLGDFQDPVSTVTQPSDTIAATPSCRTSYLSFAPDVSHSVLLPSPSHLHYRETPPKKRVRPPPPIPRELQRELDRLRSAAVHMSLSARPSLAFEKEQNGEQDDWEPQQRLGRQALMSPLASVPLPPPVPPFLPSLSFSGVTSCTLFEGVALISNESQRKEIPGSLSTYRSAESVAGRVSPLAQREDGIRGADVASEDFANDEAQPMVGADSDSDLDSPMISGGFYQSESRNFTRYAEKKTNRDSMQVPEVLLNGRLADKSAIPSPNTTQGESIDVTSDIDEPDRHEAHDGGHDSDGSLQAEEEVRDRNARINMDENDRFPNERRDSQDRQHDLPYASQTRTAESEQNLHSESNNNFQREDDGHERYRDGSLWTDAHGFEGSDVVLTKIHFADKSATPSQPESAIAELQTETSVGRYQHDSKSLLEGTRGIAGKGHSEQNGIFPYDVSQDGNHGHAHETSQTRITEPEHHMHSESDVLQRGEDGHDRYVFSPHEDSPDGKHGVRETRIAEPVHHMRSGSDDSSDRYQADAFVLDGKPHTQEDERTLSVDVPSQFDDLDQGNIIHHTQLSPISERNESPSTNRQSKKGQDELLLTLNEEMVGDEGSLSDLESEDFASQDQQPSPRVSLPQTLSARLATESEADSHANNRIEENFNRLHPVVEEDISNESDDSMLINESSLASKSFSERENSQPRLSFHPDLSSDEGESFAFNITEAEHDLETPVEIQDREPAEKEMMFARPRQMSDDDAVITICPSSSSRPLAICLPSMESPPSVMVKAREALTVRGESEDVALLSPTASLASAPHSPVFHSPPHSPLAVFSSFSESSMPFPLEVSSPRSFVPHLDSLPHTPAATFDSAASSFHFSSPILLPDYTPPPSPGPVASSQSPHDNVALQLQFDSNSPSTAAPAYRNLNFESPSARGVVPTLDHSAPPTPSSLPSGVECPAFSSSLPSSPSPIVESPLLEAADVPSSSCAALETPSFLLSTQATFATLHLPHPSTFPDPKAAPEPEREAIHTPPSPEQLLGQRPPRLCPQCSSSNVENAKCCGECGTPFSSSPNFSICPACIHSNPKNAKFCAECSLPLTSISALVQVVPPPVAQKITPSPTFHNRSPSRAPSPISLRLAYPVSSARQKCFDAFLSNEEEYYTSIQLLNDHFNNQIQAVATNAELAALFRTLAWLGKFSSKFQANLARKRDEWTERTSVGDLFLTFSVFLTTSRCFEEEYIQAKRAIDQLTISNPMFLQVCLQGAQAAGHTLSSLLLHVAQRVPKYICFVEEMLQHTTAEHPDFPLLHRALQSLQKS